MISENVRRRPEVETRNTNVNYDQSDYPDYPISDDSQDFYNDTTFWNQEASFNDYSSAWQTNDTQYYQSSAAAPQNAYFETVPRGSSASKSYVLWIDKKSEENANMAKQLTSDQRIQVDFVETFSSAQTHLRRHLDKIRSPSSTFQVICRGYYKSENKNPMDLLAFLNQNRLKHIPVLVFTQDEHGLRGHLKNQAASMNIYDWTDRLYISNDPRNIIVKCKSNIDHK